MKKILLAVCAVLALAGIAAAQVVKDLPGDLGALVATERAFSKMSVDRGINDAFLAFIADDGVLFRPGPVPGKQWLAGRQNPPVVLTWWPLHADIARSGDLGWTTGPFEAWRKDAPDKKSFGCFFTVWRKQADGNWRFVIDAGIPTATAAPPGGEPGPLKPEKKAGAPAMDAKAAEASVLEADRALAKDAGAKGLAPAFGGVLAADARLLRGGSQPFVGKEPVEKALAAGKGTFTWEPIAAAVSAAGDLGYVYGTYERKEGDATEKGHYVRVWDRAPGGSWKLALDVLNPLPPPPPPPPPPPAPPQPPVPPKPPGAAGPAA